LRVCMASQHNLSMAQIVLFAVPDGLIVNQTISPTINITN